MSYVDNCIAGSQPQLFPRVRTHGLSIMLCINKLPVSEGACRHGGIDYADSTGDEGTTGGVPGGFAGVTGVTCFFFLYDLVP